MESSIEVEKGLEWLNSDIGKWHMICTVSGEIINDRQILMPRMKENRVSMHWMNRKERIKVEIMVIYTIKYTIYGPNLWELRILVISYSDLVKLGTIMF